MATSHSSNLQNEFPAVGALESVRPVLSREAAIVPKFSILVIDDDAGDKRLLRLAMKWARFPVEVSVRVADDCEAALKGMTEGAAPLPSLVLINLERKGSKCLKALEKLKRHERTCVIPVVAWARTGDASLDEAYAAQANCVLPKPETVEQAELALTRLVNFWSLPSIMLPTGYSSPKKNF
jgi:CheY-like chemotaxis protein